MVHGMVEAGRVPVERGQLGVQRGAAGRPRRRRARRTGPRSTPSRQRPAARPARSARPTSRRSGIRGTIPSDAYSPFEIGWALSVAVARSAGPAVGGETCGEERPAEPAAPGPRAARTASTGTTASSRRTTATNATTAGGPPSTACSATTNRVGVGRVEVGVEPEDRGEVVGDLGLVQAAEVVVDRVAPDPGAGDEVVRRRRAVGDARGRRARRARSRPPVTRPRRRRSSSLARPLSPSPRAGAAAGREPLELGLHERRRGRRRGPRCVLPVSTFVRRSLTIW